MFHISNGDDAKSEWNANETHVIIPMIDGDVINKESDKILASSLTLNPLEAGDQAMLSSALEHSFVIGLDKNLFEAPSYKSDLVIIQNSDLKLLSCNNDLKNPVAYASSYADQDKNGVLWQSPVQKDKIYASDKAILEVRDELDYQDSVHDLEKNDQINLVNVHSDIASQVSKTDDEILHEEIVHKEKNDQINLVNIHSDIASQVSKTDDEILHEEIVHKEKNEKPQFINYLTVAQNAETFPNLQYLDSSKSSENCRSVDVNRLVECNFHSKSNDKKTRNRLEETLFNDKESVTKSSESEPVSFVEYLKHKTEEKEVIVSNKNKSTKDGKFEGGQTYKGVSDSLPEKSLPLKKKAKMKRTLMSYSSENQRSLLKQDMAVFNQQINMKCSLTNKKTSQKFQREESAKVDNFGFDKHKFCNIYDLVECLKKCRMINASIWQTLNSGLKEMNVDILKEMNAKKNEKSSIKSSNYSPQLKAFALVLYFKQPAAFNYLSQVYNAGWPSLKTIKDWKRQINSHQRLAFVKVETRTEHLKS